MMDMNLFKNLRVQADFQMFLVEDLDIQHLCLEQ